MRALNPARLFSKAAQATKVEVKPEKTLAEKYKDAFTLYDKSKSPKDYYDAIEYARQLINAEQQLLPNSSPQKK